MVGHALRHLVEQVAGAALAFRNVIDSKCDGRGSTGLLSAILIGEMSDRPYFLWDVTLSEGELRDRLRDEDPDVRAEWQGVVLREARFDDVWKYVALSDVIRDWPRIVRHLGRSRPFWEFLLERWRARGLLEG